MTEKTWGFTQNDLQNALVDWTRDLFKDTRYKTTDGRMIAPNVYKQFLPVPSEDEDADISDFPYIKIVVLSGKIKNFDDGNNAKQLTVMFELGIFDKDDKRQGYTDILNMAQKIENALGKTRRVQNFTVGQEFSWAVDIEDTYPYHYGIIETTFNAPRVIKEDPLA